MRSKEEAYDYRYFPEPDLVPVEPTPEWISEVIASLPLLPAARRAALAGVAGVSPAEVAVAVQKDLDGLLLASIEAGADARVALTHAEHNVDVARPLDPLSFARVVTMQVQGALTATQAKVVLAELQATGADPDDIARAHGFEAMDDEALAAVVDEVIAANPDAWAKFVAGDAKVRGFFVGQVMRATQNQADGGAVTALLGRRAAE
jgi:aspartyl-tRNA(Asn)/glutamyl-tRNA(Gln) amidotransferase subunit B